MHTFPASSEAVRHAGAVATSQQVFLFAGDVESGLITGYQLERNGDDTVCLLLFRNITIASHTLSLPLSFLPIYAARDKGVMANFLPSRI